MKNGSLTLTIKNRRYSVSLADGIDISVPLLAGPDGVRAFSIPGPIFEPFQSGEFIGDVSRGGPCNCVSVTLNPHGHCTHTECIGHISAEPYWITEFIPDPFSLARLVTVVPDVPCGSQWGISRSEIQRACHGFESAPVEALIVRAIRGESESRHFSGNHPPYFLPEAIDCINALGIDHLITDLPSLDPEEDGGALHAHRLFWSYPEAPKMNKFITEMVRIPDRVQDGSYLLHLQLVLQQSDAVPSRLMIYPIPDEQEPDTLR